MSSSSLDHRAARSSRAADPLARRGCGRRRMRCTGRSSSSGRRCWARAVIARARCAYIPRASPSPSTWPRRWATPTGAPSAEAGAVPDAPAREPLTLTRLVNGRLGTPSPLALACERGDLPWCGCSPPRAPSCRRAPPTPRTRARAGAPRRRPRARARTATATARSTRWWSFCSSAGPRGPHLPPRPRVDAQTSPRGCAWPPRDDRAHREASRPPCPDGRSAPTRPSSARTWSRQLARGGPPQPAVRREPSGSHRLSVAVSSPTSASRAVSWLLRRTVPTSTPEADGLDAHAIASDRPVTSRRPAHVTRSARHSLGGVYDERVGRAYFHYKTKAASEKRGQPRRRCAAPRRPGARESRQRASASCVES